MLIGKLSKIELKQILKIIFKNFSIAEIIKNIPSKDYLFMLKQAEVFGFDYMEIKK